MRRTIFSFLAAASLALQLRGQATTRPRYGGELRVETRATERAFDPAAWPTAGAEAASCARLAPAVFDRLVELDENGTLKPALAVSWRYDPGDRRWRFRLRPNVKFHDGSPFTAESAAAALSATAKAWQFTAAAVDELVIQAPEPAQVDLELAEAPHFIFLRGADNLVAGTGAFQRVPSQSPGKVILRANEDYWAGRPFLDSVSIEAGRPAREQVLDLELGRTDVIDLLPADIRRISETGGRLWVSAPSALLTLRVDATRPALDKVQVREALALSIDRAAICSVLLQKQGEPAGSLLPQWLSGYSFLFAVACDPARARQLVAPISPVPALSLSFDPADTVARLAAERVAVNAREVGLTLQVAPATGRPVADIQIMRIPLTSIRAAAALGGIVSAVRVPGAQPFVAQDPQGLYSQERALLADFRVIPLFHLPEIYGSNTRVRTWATAGISRLGAWRFDDIWLEQVNP